MASSSRLGALEKRRGSRDSAASTADFVDETSSEESEDDFGSSDFSSDSESGNDQPGSSTSGQRLVSLCFQLALEQACAVAACSYYVTFIWQGFNNVWQ